MDKELVVHLKSHSTVLTPTRRLATRLQEEFNQVQGQENKVWPTGLVFAFEDWLKKLWEQFEIDGHTYKYLITPIEALFRWEHIIQQSPSGQTLLRPLVTAKIALEAWALLHQWCVLEILESYTSQIDQKAFQIWAKDYQQWLYENEFCDESQLPDVVLALLIPRYHHAWHRVSPTPKIILYGFEELSPLQTQFFAQLTVQGWQIEQIPLPSREPHLLKNIRFQEMEEEWKAAAVWARSLLTHANARIAIVIPNLVDYRKKIETLFNDVLTPLSACQPDAQINKLVNISAAIPLAQYPIIQAALNFLQLVTKWSLDLYGSLIQSPFLGNSEKEFLLRARFFSLVKAKPAQNNSLLMACKFLSVLPDLDKPANWQLILQQLTDYTLNLPAVQTWGEWAEHFKKMLALAFWPGERFLNSIEFQAVTRWQILVDSLASFDQILPQADLSQAYQLLLKLAMHTPFQPENRKAPIQILGVLEAAGQQFDYLWVMGLHNEAWPAPAAPNPFIALEKQRSLNMPHASAHRQTQYAQKMLMRLKQSASQVIFSFACQEGGRQLEISELIRDLPQEGWDKKACEVQSAEDLIPLAALEKITDDKAPILMSQENFVATSNTLALQAACPFKAFAQERLGARCYPTQKAWLQPLERGIILHKILEDLWTKFPAQKALQQLRADQLNETLTHLIAKRLKPFLTKETPLYYQQTETERLNIILQRYLALEFQRPPFMVEAIEQEQTWVFAGIAFKLRCDRIDKDENNEFILIDYKTGQFKLSDLWGERPHAPQLGLYALAWQSHYQPYALVVMKLSLQKCEWIGLSAKSWGIDGIQTVDKLKEKNLPEQWSDFQAYWHHQLYFLATEFKEGNAKVDPVQGTVTCQFCHLRPLCRIGENEVYD